MTLSGGHVVVVLGMHRSGTSAMTRALDALGVGLGDRFIPDMPDVNRKGFWEDADVNQLNIALLDDLGLDWFHWRTPGQEMWAHPGLDQRLSQAKDLLTQRLAGQSWFGFKDPRTVLLLPFWQRVMEALGVRPHYLIALRNPLSVAASLARRNGFDPVRSHYMWLQYMVPCLTETEGQTRVVVDFDRFIQSTRDQMVRLAEGLHLPGPRGGSLDGFIQGFIEPDLRHSRHGLDDLLADPWVPVPVLETYRLLLAVADDTLSVDDSQVRAHFNAMARHLDEMRPLFGYLDRMESRLARCESRPSAAVPEPDSPLQASLPPESSASPSGASARRPWHRWFRK